MDREEIKKYTTAGILEIRPYTEKEKEVIIKLSSVLYPLYKYDWLEPAPRKNIDKVYDLIADWHIAEIEKAKQETFDATIQAIKDQGIEAVSGINYSELEKQVLRSEKQ